MTLGLCSSMINASEMERNDNTYFCQESIWSTILFEIRGSQAPGRSGGRTAVKQKNNKVSSARLRPRQRFCAAYYEFLAWRMTWRNIVGTPKNAQRVYEKEKKLQESKNYL